MRIHQLPPAVANQIAAGEVIERPASVVKELLENSLDAGADTITIEIGYGGLNQIKISDNGKGIFAEDLPLAVAAHATSKISNLNDLYAISSMGFRGEALASIASVAKITISSRPAEQQDAMMLRMKGAEITLSVCARAQGTTIDVVDLFFNAPVRKRFLKSEKLEFQAIEAVCKRFALSAPSIALHLKHNNKSVWSLPAAHTEQAKLARITKLLGTGFVKDAITLTVERGSMRLAGWISGPNYQRSQNDKQWVYINQRMVKDKLINHAVKQAYEDLLHPGRFPACLLYFTIDTNEVDVNVHPTKHEVRFQQPRLVHDFFSSQLKAALQTTNSHQAAVQYDLGMSSDQTMGVCEPRVNANALANQPAPLFTQNTPEPLTDTQWVILNKHFVLVFLARQPFVVDIVAFYEEWLRGELQSMPKPLPARPLLVPFTYTLSEGMCNQFATIQAACAQVGIQMIQQQANQLVIRSLPVAVPYLDIPQFLQLLEQQTDFQSSTLVGLLSRAQRFDPHLFSPEERNALNQQLVAKGDGVQRFSRALTEDNCRMLLHV